jgi:hypothetical protein
MTDQPLIYWQDHGTTLTDTTEPDLCCTIKQAHYAGEYIIETARVDLTTTQARELGHALITRAIMATPVDGPPTLTLEIDHYTALALRDALCQHLEDCPCDEAHILLAKVHAFLNPASTPQEDGTR